MSEVYEVIDLSQREANEELLQDQAAMMPTPGKEATKSFNAARFNSRPKPERKYSGTLEKCEVFVAEALAKREDRKLEIREIAAPEKERPEPKNKPVVIQRSEPETVDIASVVVDLDIYPRKEWSQATIRRYADAMDAGAEFPPIVLEKGTRRLLDGMHRLKAAESLELATIVAERHQVPDDASPLLYAASLSSAHGDRITNAEMREIARHEAVARGLDHGVGEAVARYLSAHPRSVRRWIADLYEEKKQTEDLQARLLTESGLSPQATADALGTDRSDIRRRVGRNGQVTDPTTPDQVRGALATLPEQYREAAEQVAAKWETAGQASSNGERPQSTPDPVSQLFAKKFAVDKAIDELYSFAVYNRLHSDLAVALQEVAARVADYQREDDDD